MQVTVIQLQIAPMAARLANIITPAVTWNLSLQLRLIPVYQSQRYERRGQSLRAWKVQE
jgi:hypothetical protein